MGRGGDEEGRGGGGGRSHPNPRVGQLNRVGGPPALHGALLHPREQAVGEFWQVQEHMARGAHFHLVARVGLAARLLQLDRVQQATARVALVPARVVVAALWTLALNEAVCQKALAAQAKHLLRVLLHDQTVVAQLAEDVLGDHLRGDGAWGVRGGQ